MSTAATDQLFREFLDCFDETIGWCRPLVDIANPRDCLRSPELCPDVFGPTSQERVQSVVARRRQAARTRTGPHALRERRDVANARTGRILVFEPGINLYFGLEADQCGHFIDENNNPAWDTWIMYFEGNTAPDVGVSDCLVCWVPDEFVEGASRAMDVSVEQCHRWLDARGGELADLIAALRIQ